MLLKLKPDISPSLIVSSRLEELSAVARDRRIDTEAAKTSSALLTLIGLAGAANPLFQVVGFVGGTMYVGSIALDYMKTRRFFPLPIVRKDMAGILEGFSGEGSSESDDVLDYLTPTEELEHTVLEAFPGQVAAFLEAVQPEDRAVAYSYMIRQHSQGQSFEQIGFKVSSTPAQAKAPTSASPAATPAQTTEPSHFVDLPLTTDKLTVNTSTERSLFHHLADNPFLCYFILASQRTGKTSSAAAASLTIKRESGTQIFYINLSDHGQGNREAFSHATRAAIGNINGGSIDSIADLIVEATEVIEDFHASNNAILIVDEWVSLAAKGRGILDELWECLSPKADALTSNGIGCGRAVWAIAPRFQAGTMREEAKVVKNFVPLLLSIAPEQTVSWTNPNNGTTAKLSYNGALIGQAQANWKESGITEPTAEQSRQWKQDGVTRIFWADKKWSALGQAPIMAATK